MAQRAKGLYPLDEVLLLCLLGVLAGSESWVEISKYGEKKLDFLRRFRPSPKAPPPTTNSALSSRCLTPSRRDGASPRPPRAATKRWKRAMAAWKGAPSRRSPTSPSRGRAMTGQDSRAWSGR